MEQFLFQYLAPRSTKYFLKYSYNPPPQKKNQDCQILFPKIPKIHNLRSVQTCNIQTRIHECAEWFANPHKRFANQMRVCVDGTANLCCPVRKWLPYHSPQSKICWLTGCAVCSFHALDVLFSSQVRRKLINRAPLTRRTRTVGKQWWTGRW